MPFDSELAQIKTDFTRQPSTLTPAAMSAPRKRKYRYLPVAMRMYTNFFWRPGWYFSREIQQTSTRRHSSKFPNMVGILLCFYQYLLSVCVNMLFLNISWECNNLWESKNSKYNGTKYHWVGTSVDMINCGRLEIVRNRTRNFDVISAIGFHRSNYFWMRELGKQKTPALSSRPLSFSTKFRHLNSCRVTLTA